MIYILAFKKEHWLYDSTSTRCKTHPCRLVLLVSSTIFELWPRFAKVWLQGLSEPYSFIQWDKFTVLGKFCTSKSLKHYYKSKKNHLNIQNHSTRSTLESKKMTLPVCPLRPKAFLKWQPCHFPVMASSFVVLIYLSVFQFF